MGGGAAPQLPTRARPGGQARTAAWLGCHPLALALGAQLLWVGAALAAPGDVPPAREPDSSPRSGFAALTDQSALVPSPAVEQARLTAALAEELSSSLRQLAGVKDARVHLLVAAPGQGPLGEPPAPAKASVLLVLEAGTERVDEAAVRALVAGAAPGVTAEAVSVVLSRKRAASATPTPDSPAPGCGAARLLRWALLALLGSQLLLAALTIALLRRVRSVESLTRR
jgi:type III secretory pathway lipoprotein EscJ